MRVQKIYQADVPILAVRCRERKVNILLLGISTRQRETRSHSRERETSVSDPKLILWYDAPEA